MNSLRNVGALALIARAKVGYYGQTKVTLTGPAGDQILIEMEPINRRMMSGASLAAPIAERREKRLHVAVPVKLFLEADSTNYQLCCTYEISMIGARLVAVSGVTKTGQIVWLQRHNRRARYKVIWIGEPGTQQAEQIGVELLEPNTVIWESELQMRISRQ